VTTERLKTTDEAAAWLTANGLRVVSGTLANWRGTGRGPRFVKLSGAVRYREMDLKAYLAQPSGGGSTTE